MSTRLRFALLLSTITTTLAIISIGCSGTSGASYEPCERGEEECICELPEEEDPFSESCAREDDFEWGWEDPADDDDEPCFGDECLDPDDGTNDDGDDELSYRFVLLEDMTDPIAGNAPGSDIDAVAIEKNGVEFYATSVVDFNIGAGNNEYIDPTEALGAPDSQCEKKNFVSLGGKQADGYLILEFSDPSRDVTIDPGDQIIVYELGNAVCPTQPTWDNDPTAVSISVSDDRGSFEYLFVTGDGQNVVTVP